MIQDILLGFTFPIRGMKAIFSSKILFCIAIIPLLIALSFFWLGFSSVSPLIDGWVAVAMNSIFTSTDGLIYKLIYYPLMAIFWLVFLISLGLFVYLLTSVIASPFNGLLAERILMRDGVIANEPFHLGRLLLNAFRMFRISILRSFILIIIGLLLFLTSFIPVVHLISAFFAFILVAFDAADYSLEARKMNLRERFQYLDKHRAVFFGMGLAVGIFAIIPGLLLLAMPPMVAGFADLSKTLEGR